MRVKLLVLAALVFTAGKVEASILTHVSSFSGSETLVTFGTAAKAPTVEVSGITFVNNSTGDLESDGPWDRGYLFGKAPDDGQLNDFTGLTDIDIFFGTETVNRVGMMLSNAISTTWFLEAFDADDNLLGSGSVTSVQIDVAPLVGNEWPIYAAPVFLGFESATDISRVRIFETFNNGQITVMDDLRFEAVPAAVPEPSTLALLGVAGICIAGRVLRKRRKAVSTAV